MYNLKNLKHFAIALLLLIPFSVNAESLPNSVKLELNQLKLSPDTLSVYAKDLSTGKSVLEWNHNRSGNPASSIKVLTTFAGIDLLGPDYKWPTDFYYTGTLQNKVLNGDLYIKGYGDPSFVNESMQAAVAILRQHIDSINGNILIDNTYFQLPSNYPVSLDGQDSAPYNAIPDAMNMNFGTNLVKITPVKSSSKALLDIDPPVITRNVINNTKQNNKKCQWYGASYQKQNQTLTVSAQPSVYCKPSSSYSVIVKPYEIVAGGFKKEWLKQIGKLSNNYQVRVATLPANAKFLWRHLSKPLSEQIKDMNKSSNNVMTRQLFLTLGAEKLNPPSTLDKSRNVINKWLFSSGINPTQIVVDNGAGLSRLSRITPMQMVQVIERANQHKFSKVFIDSLAIAGVDGTMRKRFKNQPAHGNLHIKTGTLNNVRTMAGIVYSKSGHVYAVSSIHEAPRIEFQKGTRVQNKILDWLYNL